MTLDHMFNDTTYSARECAKRLGMNRWTFTAHCIKAYGKEAYEARFPTVYRLDPALRFRLSHLVRNTELSSLEISNVFGLSLKTVSKFVKEILTPQEFMARESAHRSRAVREIQGTNPATYKVIKAPEWYSGPVSSSGWGKEHHIVWCAANGVTEVPKGYNVHHIDHDHRNNDPSNLMLMTHSEHTSHHNASRRLPVRLSSSEYPSCH
jgi:DNA-binding CsgD family transcriptional regulator